MFKKEFFIFISIFLFLALGMHMNQWIAHPFQHLHNLTTHKMPYHPLLYTFLVYLLIGILRIVFNIVAKLFRKR